MINIKVQNTDSSTLAPTYLDLIFERRLIEMNNSLKRVLPAAIALSLGLTAMPAAAYEAGDWIVRARLITVNPVALLLPQMAQMSLAQVYPSTMTLFLNSISPTW